MSVVLLINQTGTGDEVSTVCRDFKGHREAGFSEAGGQCYLHINCKLIKKKKHGSLFFLASDKISHPYLDLYSTVTVATLRLNMFLINQWKGKEKLMRLGVKDIPLSFVSVTA